MGAKKTVQKKGKHESALADIGMRKMDASKVFNPATDYTIASAKRDSSGLYRGRASADAAQAFAKPNQNVHGSIASGRRPGGLSSLAKIRTAEGKGTASALSEGTKRGVLSRDTNIANAINIGIGQQAQSSRAMSSLAQAEFGKMKAQADIAAKESNDRRGAVMGLASLGAGKFMEGKNDALDASNQRDFNDANSVLEASGQSRMSMNEWAQTSKGQPGGYQAEHKSWGLNALNRFSGTG